MLQTSTCSHTSLKNVKEAACQVQAEQRDVTIKGRVGFMASSPLAAELHLLNVVVVGRRTCCPK